MKDLFNKLINSQVSYGIPCIKCGTTVHLKVLCKDLSDFQNGRKLIQEAFPYLTSSQREMFLTRICPSCWDKLFKED